MWEDIIAEKYLIMRKETPNLGVLAARNPMQIIGENMQRDIQ